METVLDALKAMGKASCREIAARLDIDHVDAMAMLREQKEQGLCDFEDGGWFLGVRKQSPAPAHQAPRQHGEPPAPVDPDVIRQLLRENGAMNTASLAAAVNRNARGMVSVMLAFERQGIVVKNGEGKGVTWSLPTGAVAEPVAAELAPRPEEKPVQNKTTAEIVQDIPVFVARPDDLIVPSARFFSREVRRARTILENLQKAQQAAYVLRRNKHLLESLSND